MSSLDLTESFDPIVHLVLGERIEVAFRESLCEQSEEHERHLADWKEANRKGYTSDAEMSKRHAVECWGRISGLRMAHNLLTKIINTPNETRTLADQKRKEINAELARLDELIESAQAVTGALRGAIK